MNADGSGLRPVMRAEFPSWSPDGTQIAFGNTAVIIGSGRLAVADADGTNRRSLSFARYGPWNQLPRSATPPSGVSTDDQRSASSMRARRPPIPSISSSRAGNRLPASTSPEPFRVRDPDGLQHPPVGVGDALGVLDERRAHPTGRTARADLDVGAAARGSPSTPAAVRMIGDPSRSMTETGIAVPASRSCVRST